MKREGGAEEMRTSIEEKCEKKTKWKKKREKNERRKEERRREKRLKT